MSYDLAFWREITPAGQPSEVYDQVIDDVDVDGLAALPLDQIKRRFTDTFPGIDDEGAEMTWEGDGSHFQLSWPPDPVNALLVSCGYQLPDDTMNRIIEIANEFGCALYDPQTDERYPQADPMPR